MKKNEIGALLEKVSEFATLAKNGLYKGHANVKGKETQDSRILFYNSVNAILQIAEELDAITSFDDIED